MFALLLLVYLHILGGSSIVSPGKHFAVCCECNPSKFSGIIFLNDINPSRNDAGLFFSYCHYNISSKIKMRIPRHSG
ncbi:MAG: hypothetical protein O7D30_05810 [Rickettsia endosymbiont of Ixodes persulcatus]|nr:hypothetical protein [Rickettsia endosymbiont of Ixodes persulcatus]